MKFVASRGAIRSLPRWMQRALFAFALLALGYCWIVLADSWMFQKDQRRQLERAMAARRIAAAASLASALPAVADGMIGLVEIPSLGLSVTVRNRVESTKVFDPSNVEVLGPSRNQILTLVTCYPFYYVGPAPARFIVRAKRVI